LRETLLRGSFAESPVEKEGGEHRRESRMAARKQLQTNLTEDPELTELLRDALSTPVSEEELREQRVSFAYGNAPQSELITKESVRKTAQNIRLT